MDSVLEKLRNWRSRRGLTEGIDLFRILSNKTLEDIARAMPKTKAELLEIKGFKEKKFQKYGKEILDIINGGGGTAVEGMESLFELRPVKRSKVTQEIIEEEAKTPIPEERIFSVSDYLDLINVALQDFQAKVVGEVSSLDIRGNYLFFGLKDKKDGSTLSCFMWQSNYRVSGVNIAEGMEIMVYGHPNIYKAAGKISMQVEAIELVGEGALKKAYDELKKKLEAEGLFALEKKRPIPEFPEKIGLITSKTGAVIHDFLNNIGKFGYKIKFLDSRVEGQLAVKDLLAAVRYFKDKDIDVLVMIRGGGSLESLQAFNNEMLVREIAEFPKPVMVGIGHDKDLPLVSLAADLQVSTPTAVTKVLNGSWERALAKVEILKRDIFNNYNEIMTSKARFLDRAGNLMKHHFGEIFKHFREVEEHLKLNFQKLGFRLKNIRTQLKNEASIISSHFFKNLTEVSEKLKNVDQIIQINNPERQLRLGYGIVRMSGKVIKSVRDVSGGDEIDIKVADGSIKSKVLDKSQ